MPAPGSNSRAVCRGAGENRDAIKRATVTGVRNCPSAALRFGCICRPTSLRTVSTCSSHGSIAHLHGPPTIHACRTLMRGGQQTDDHMLYIPLLDGGSR